MTDRTASRRLGAGILQLAVALLVATYALPYIYLLMTSLKPAADVLQIPPRFLPETLSVDNYRAIFANPSVPLAFFNSLVVAVLSTGLALLLAVPAAYGASFFRTRLSAWFLLFALVTRMVPSVSLGVPLFILLKNIGLLDTISGLVLAHTTLSLPLAVWLMAAFFESIPRELEEAARMDGCTRFAAFWHIILPPASGGIAITALFSFIASWNEFLYALLLSAQHAKTAPIIIAQYKGAFGLDWGPMSALAILYSLPVILVTLVLQKKIIGGLTFGAVKG
ncbi:maltose ABC transporter permease [Devosia yakushimensis]|uniref:Maltose/maltodextrin transport system permease protein MalG n=1 Tax=Devosia yakushimensis TaxID=470028 RepID=A0ABQ5UI88_9HYPH|nr:carbohydrate ABC transporter permease [Devosia yakushimensis]GLQ11323.1 maltose ABC transporter permease [Devosia yakushimensis]